MNKLRDARYSFDWGMIVMVPWCHCALCGKRFRELVGDGDRTRNVPKGDVDNCAAHWIQSLVGAGDVDHVSRCLLRWRCLCYHANNMMPDVYIKQVIADIVAGCEDELRTQFI